MKLLNVILILSLLQLTSFNTSGSVHLLENNHSSGESLHFHLLEIAEHLDGEDDHDDTGHTHIQTFELSYHSDVSSYHVKETWKENHGFCVLRMSYKPNLPPPDHLG